MKRYLLLGECEVDITWLEIRSDNGHVTHRQIVPLKIYKAMPAGYTGPASGLTINGSFSQIHLEVPKGQWLTVIPENKLPVNAMCITIE